MGKNVIHAMRYMRESVVNKEELLEMLAFAMWAADYGIDEEETGWQIGIHLKEWNKHKDCCDWCKSAFYRYAAEIVLEKFEKQ